MAEHNDLRRREMMRAVSPDWHKEALRSVSDLSQVGKAEAEKLRGMMTVADYAARFHVDTGKAALTEAHRQMFAAAGKQIADTERERSERLRESLRLVFHKDMEKARAQILAPLNQLAENPSVSAWKEYAEAQNERLREAAREAACAFTERHCALMQAAQAAWGAEAEETAGANEPAPALDQNEGE